MKASFDHKIAKDSKIMINVKKEFTSFNLWRMRKLSAQKCELNI
jgi:hypothetical protein